MYSDLSFNKTIRNILKIYVCSSNANITLLWSTRHPSSYGHNINVNLKESSRLNTILKNH